MKKDSFVPQAIELVVLTVIGTAVTFILEHAFSNLWIGILCGVTITFILALILYVSRFKKFKRILGISELYKNHESCSNLEQIIKTANTSVDFLGISLRTLFETADIENTLIEKAQQGVKFRFLVIDSTSPFLALKAQDEGSTAGAWVSEITSGLNRLRHVKSRISTTDTVEVRHYDAMPIWRNVFIDDKIVYSSFYPHGKRGKTAPIAVFEKRHDSFYIPLDNEFEYLWGISKVIP